MRIAYFHGAAVPSRAASTVQALKMGEALESIGHSVLMLVPNKPETDRTISDVFSFYGVQPLTEFARAAYPRCGTSYITAMDMVLRARQFRAELVYSRFLIGAYFAALAGLPVIHEVHRPIGHFGRSHRFAFNGLIRSPRFKHLVTISNSLKSAFERDFANLDGKVIVAHDGANVPGASMERRPTTEVERLDIGYLGSLFAGKGAELVVALAERCPFANFHIIGGRDVEVYQLRSETQHVPNLKVHGYLPHPVALERLAFFDLVLAPYGKRVSVYGDANADISEYMSPLKLFEYMAAGKAIICSDHDVLKEIVVHDESAWICRRDSVQDWEGAIVSLSQNRVLRTRLGEGARASLAKNFTWPARAARVLKGLECAEKGSATSRL